MERNSFVVEHIDDYHITVRDWHGYQWSFLIATDSKSGRRVITSGKSGANPNSPDGPAHVVTDALRFARKIARTRGLID
jgi:hypothetical protein